MWKNKLKFTFYVRFYMTITLGCSCLFILLLILINFLLLILFFNLTLWPKFLASPLDTRLGMHNPTMWVLKYYSNKKFLGGVTLLIITPGITWTQLYIYIYIN